AGFEEGLAAGVLLVQGRPVRVGRSLARREDLQPARIAQMATARLVGAGEARRQGAVGAGEIAVDLVDDAGGLIGRGKKREDAVLDGVMAGLGVDRALDERRAGGEVFLEDQEIPLPRRLARGLVAPGFDGDRYLASERRLGDGVLEGLRVDRRGEPGRQGLA